ncbi:MAG: TerC family protein, partial [Syntrophothermus sp.]
MHWNIHELLIFSGFLLFIFMMLALDLGVFNKKSHALTFREALMWTTAWVALSFIFYLLIRFFGHELHGFTSLEQLQSNIVKYHHPISVDGLTLQEAIPVYNRNLSLEFLTGYLIEYSLSVDNIFVIIMIFLSFNIRQKYYHKVLFWGILGALIMRFIFIFLASALIQRFEWILYVFGGLLVIFGGRMIWEFFTSKGDERIDTHKHPVVRFLSKFFPVSEADHGSKFLVKLDNKI